MEYSFVFSLDSVEIVYDEEVESYQVFYRRVVKNIGTEPLEAIPGKILVQMFPDDPELSRFYSRLYPLDFSALEFVAEDESGVKLSPILTMESDNLIEFRLPLQDPTSGRLLPIYPGQERTIAYHYRVAEAVWGPYFERALTAPCEQMSVTLRFPAGQVHLWGESLPDHGSKRVLTPAIDQHTSEDQDVFQWSLTPAEMHTHYYFYWRFKDARWEALQSWTQQQTGTSPTINHQFPSHSPDFCSVFWYGTLYSFSPLQAACVELLWKEWVKQTLDLTQNYILENIGTKATRMKDIFGSNDAWQKMIVSGNTKGTFRLRSPDTSEKAP